jgi:hypothetical protein
MTKIPPPTPAPSTLDWDLWLGCANYRPYTAGDKEYDDFVLARSARSGRQPTGSVAMSAGRGSAPGRSLSTEDPLIQLAPQGGGFYMPWNWRGFYDFGSSLIGDWGVHILGPANWALQLHPKYLLSVECLRKDSLPPFTFPDELAFRFDFAERPGMPPVSVYWYHHGGEGEPYTPPGMTIEEARKVPGTGPQVGPQQGQGGFFAGSGGGVAANAAGPGAGARGGARRGSGQQGSGYNCIFAGTKGYLGTGGRGEGVGLLPGSRWAEYKLPSPYLQRSPGASTSSNHPAHIRDWVRSCKGGAPACSNFSIAGPYTEWLILGAAAVHAEGKLLWDYKNCQFTNNKSVNQWVKPSFRKGWELRL